MTIHARSTTGADQLALVSSPRSTTSRTVGHHRGEEVTDMKRLGRSVGARRAWDELSETDRRVLLVNARQRRAEQAQRDARFIDVYAQRVNK